MIFEVALDWIKKGTKAYRKGWNGIEAGIIMYVFLTSHTRVHYLKPDNRRDDIDTEPFFVFYHDKNGTHNVWVPSTWDILASDWELVK